MCPDDHPSSEFSDCPVEIALKVVGDKWTVRIVHSLFKGSLRFGEIRDALPNISNKVLTEKLRLLEMRGIVERIDMGTPNPMVIYTLTRIGYELQDVFDCMAFWGSRYSSLISDDVL